MKTGGCLSLKGILLLAPPEELLVLSGERWFKQFTLKVAVENIDREEKEMFNTYDTWVDAQNTLFFAEAVMIAGNKKWADTLRSTAKAQIDLLRELDPTLPPALSIQSRTYIREALRNTLMQYLGVSSFDASFIDEDGYVWPENEMYTTPFGMESYSSAR